jgi:hypothetical protein
VSQTGLSASLHFRHQVFFQSDGVIVLGIFRTKEQGDGSLPGCSIQLFDVLALIIQFRGVSLLKLLPLVRIVCEPFPQLGTRRDFLKPLIDARLLLRQSPRPQSINQYAMAVGFRWLVINTFEPNAHVLLSQRIRRSAVRVASEVDNPACPTIVAGRIACVTSLPNLGGEDALQSNR